MISPHRWVTAALAVAATFAVVSPAAAEPDVLPTPPPIWSGLDARDHTGPIPQRAGTLIEQRPLDRRLWLPDAGSATRILYSTTDGLGRRAVSTGSITVPRGTPPAGGWPMLAWAHGTVGMGDDCAPSAQRPSADDIGYLGHWLRRGYAIVATDYVGQGTPGPLYYLDSTTAAHSVVDSVVAARAGGLPLARRWATLGHSQGGAAALAAARNAPDFSAGSGLDFRGGLATGVPADLESILPTLGPQFPPVVLPRALNAYVLYILAGFRSARPDLRIDDLLTVRGRSLVDRANSACGRELRPFTQGLDLRTLFRRPLASIPDAYGAIRRYLGTPDSGYTRPVFIGQGLADVNVPAPSALSLATQMTAHRQPLELHVYPAADHPGVLTAVLPDADRFLARILR
ncbi:alpha/beta hydrolase family protein [Williamsia deligens]|uniref:Alpha/beta hydrolase family protein n=1 Tax=Williamsia deligens TaxID=321325 RepID=A0ABW3G5W1_9NOCA|nr:lipase family protein [Williamsia deligens]MCP2193549.1 Alpha/beta hydrolase family protein [Williamsia deligens]